MHESAPIKDHWDVVVIGTGMGGATTGYALAQSGLNVLFLESGKDTQSLESHTGSFAEDFFSANRFDTSDIPRTLKNSGRTTAPIFFKPKRSSPSFIPFLGAGTGGSSALYGSVLERFDGTEMPENMWPSPARDLNAWYDRAEELYHIQKNRNPEDLQDIEQEFQIFIAGKNIPSYTLPLALRDPKTCAGCQGFLCPNPCKQHAGNVCVDQACQKYGATLMTERMAKKLNVSRGRVTSLEYQNPDGTTMSITGKLFILGAGALHTPELLLNSTSPEYPNGIANTSGLVGKNLMRHFSILYAVQMKNKPKRELHKGLGIDLSDRDGNKMTLQSFYPFPSFAAILFNLRQALQNKIGRFTFIVMPFIKLILKKFMFPYFQTAMIMALILEDEPQENNSVSIIDHDGTKKIFVHYAISKNDALKIKEADKTIQKILSPLKFKKIDISNDPKQLAHMCGTCKMGISADKSVVDPWNKCHDLDNLYIVDSSYLPTSGRHGPSLTIAANALRVADHIIKQWKA